VVTFGGDVVYAAELTNDPEEAYENYQSAVTPDRSSTNIAAALPFAHGKLSADLIYVFVQYLIETFGHIGIRNVI